MISQKPLGLQLRLLTHEPLEEYSRLNHNTPVLQENAKGHKRELLDEKMGMPLQAHWNFVRKCLCVSTDIKAS